MMMINLLMWHIWTYLYLYR